MTKNALTVPVCCGYCRALPCLFYDSSISCFCSLVNKIFRFCPLLPNFVILHKRRGRVLCRMTTETQGVVKNTALRTRYLIRHSRQLRAIGQLQCPYRDTRSPPSPTMEGLFGSVFHGKRLHLIHAGSLHLFASQNSPHSLSERGFGLSVAVLLIGRRSPHPSQPIMIVCATFPAGEGFGLS